MEIVNKEKSGKFSRRLIMTAIFALVGFVFTGCALDKKDSNAATIEVPATPSPSPEVSFDVEKGYSSIYKIDEVKKIANDIYNNLKLINPDIIINENEIMDIIGALEVGQVSYVEELKQHAANGNISAEEISMKIHEGIAFNIRNLDELMTFENQHNISLGLPRMLDNDDRGYELAQEISDLRSNMYKAINSGDKNAFTSYAQQFTNMYGKILFEGGPLVLNTNGEKAFILKYFDSTAAYIFTYGDMRMKYMCANGGEATLIDMVAELSEAICETENGRFPNQLSEAMNGMSIIFINGLYVAFGYDNVPMRNK